MLWSRILAKPQHTLASVYVDCQTVVRSSVPKQNWNTHWVMCCHWWRHLFPLRMPGIWGHWHLPWTWKTSWDHAVRLSVCLLCNAFRSDFLGRVLFLSIVENILDFKTEKKKPSPLVQNMRADLLDVEYNLIITLHHMVRLLWKKNDIICL